MKKDWKSILGYGLLSIFGIALFVFIRSGFRSDDSKEHLPKSEPKLAESDTILDITYYVEPGKALVVDSMGLVRLEYHTPLSDTIVQVMTDSVKLLQLNDDWKDKRFPDAVFALKNLRYLGIGMRGFKTIPPGISQLTQLEEIDFQHGAIEKLPDDFCQLRNLRRAVFLFSNLKELPECFGDLEKLEYLHLGFTHVTRFPESMKNLKNLKVLLIHQSPDEPHISQSEYLKLKTWLPGCGIDFRLRKVD